jgi:hypothetical protein
LLKRANGGPSKNESLNQTSREEKARRQGHRAFSIESTAEPPNHQADGGMITVSMT